MSFLGVDEPVAEPDDPDAPAPFQRLSSEAERLGRTGESSPLIEENLIVSCPAGAVIG
jgi:hypothetical protein